jgi:hypothetical protein
LAELGCWAGCGQSIPGGSDADFNSNLARTLRCSSASKVRPLRKPGLLEPYLKSVRSAAEPVDPPIRIRACRDSRDDKFLEVAVHGHADLIVTGDRDLLDLHPFRGIGILTPAAYLELA